MQGKRGLFLVPRIKKYIKSKIFKEPVRFLDLIYWHEQFIKKSHSIQRGAYLEFGTYLGNSALAFYHALNVFYNNNIPDGAYPMFLFDSFEGLPESNDSKDDHPSWAKGVFDVGGVERFIKIVTEKGLPRKRFEVIPGFYEQSLKTYELPKGLKASIVNVDCDYYSSTKEVLNFLRPYLQNFTIFYFDDLHSFSGNPNKGQVAAIKEFNIENKNMGIQPCPIFNSKYEGRIFWSWVDS